MANIEKLKERLAKILRLAHDDAATEGEKAAAMEQANRIMTEHQISEADLVDRVDEFGHVYVQIRSNSADWSVMLALGVKELLPVELLISGGRYLLFCGAETDRQLAVFLYEAIRNQIRKELNAYLKLKRIDARTKKGRIKQASFLLGAATVVKGRMWAMRRQRDIDLAKHEKALLVVNDKAAQAKEYASALTNPDVPKFTVGEPADLLAEEAGRRAGKKVQITEGLEA